MRREVQARCSCPSRSRRPNAGRPTLQRRAFARLPLALRLARWHPPSFFRLQPRRLSNREIVDSLTLTPRTRFKNSRLLERDAAGRRLRSASKSRLPRSSILWALAGCFPRLQWTPLACQPHIALDGREAHPEQACGLAIVQAAVEGFHYLPAQVFRVSFHTSIMLSRSTSSQGAV